MIYYTTGKGDGKFSEIGKKVEVAVETTAQVLLKRGIISTDPFETTSKPIVEKLDITKEKQIDKPQRGRTKR